MITPFLIAASLDARAANPCADLDPGDPTPAEVTAHLDEQVSFLVCGGSTDEVDTSTCTWWVDETEGLGEVQPTTGSDVTWTAPAELEACIPVTFRLWVACADPGTTSWATITVQCDEDDKSDVREITRSTEVSGGGCTSSPIAALLVLPAIRGSRRARRWPGAAGAPPPRPR